MIDEGLVALQEIVHFGAIVSPEAAAIYRELDPGISISRVNARAATQFFQTVVHGKNFATLFSLFLQRNFPNLLQYSTELFYPGVVPKVMATPGGDHVTNPWEGPQLIISDEISTASASYILITSMDPSEIAQVRRLNFPTEKIFALHDVLLDYRDFFQAKSLNPGQHAYVHLALRDLALRNNSVNTPLEQVCFKE
jgi:hypothetical protein